MKLITNAFVSPLVDTQLAGILSKNNDNNIHLNKRKKKQHHLGRET
ncbi:hypothetical protein SynRS9902_00662 [Synechococcus sp. RS9902]|nr:hypothetical protein SynRS9902_00662 [Synechococcus sp. RS9902]